jgi:endonuclease/exonuclease/phosphatase family metal-dependent hydrolase
VLGITCSAACVTRRPPVLGEPQPANCRGGSEGVEWNTPQTTGRQSLDRWCASVGPPVVIHAPAPTSVTERVIVVSWNVHVGAGRISELADVLDTLASSSGSDRVAFVWLIQEAVRTGDAVPAEVPGGIYAARAERPDRRDGDVVALARSRNWSLAYVPSMRNGDSTAPGEREDRGAAILSSLPLGNITAIELPFGRQRRVAVMATIDPAGPSPLQVVSAHLDVVGGAGRQANHLAASISSAITGYPIVLGIDTNAIRGFRSRTVRLLDRSLRVLRECGDGRTNAWLSRIDFIFSNIVPARIGHCQTLPARYGSDHRPIVL